MTEFACFLRCDVFPGKSANQICGSANYRENCSDKTDFAASVEHVNLPVPNLTHRYSFIGKCMQAITRWNEVTEIKIICD